MSFFSQVFTGFYSLRLHRQQMHNAQNISQNKNVDVTQLVGEIDNECFKEELETCKHFLVDSRMENGRHRVFNVAMEILYANTLSQELDTMFEKLKCAANLNIVFGFVLNNVEDGTCRYYYAHEKNTLMKRSKLVMTKYVLVKMKNVLSITDVIEACTNERAKTT